MPEPILKVEDVHTYYGPLHVLKGVNYDLYEDEIVCLLGGNASGKSTTQRAPPPDGPSTVMWPPWSATMC